jgi:hypothetical protein
VLYSVVVIPERWTGSLDALARQLAPALDMREDAVSRMLARGPMTAEADLTRGQAERLAKTMAARGIPTVVLDVSGAAVLTPEVAATSSTPPDDPFADLDAFVEIDAPLEPGFDAFAELGDVASELDLSPAPPEPSDPWSVLDASSAPPEPTPSPRPEGAPSGGAWGSLFPDLAASGEPTAPTGVASSPAPDFGATPSSLEGPKGPPVVDLGADDLGPAPDFGATPAVAEPTPPRAAAPPTQIASTGIPGAPRYEKRRERPEPRDLSSPSTPRPSSAPRDRGHVDAAELARAIGGSEQAPPHAPTGFDDRVPHAVEIAVALSVLAPGAGQVYNGQDDLGTSTLVWSFLIVPWVKSVPQARERAKKVASYWAPWPEEGSIKRALRHVLIFYVIVASLGAFASWTWGKVVERAERAERVELLARIDASVDASVARTAAAVEAADDEMVAAEEELDATRLTDDERAEALYERSISMCQAFMFEECAKAMQRVNELSPGYKGAARLQAWANFRLSGAQADYPLADGTPTGKGADAGAFDDAGAPDAGVFDDAGAPDDDAGQEASP